MIEKLKKFWWQILAILGLGVALAAGVGMPAKNEVSLEKFTQKYEQASEIKVKYQMEGASLKRAVKDNPKDMVRVEIGDKDSTEFTPKIKFSRWDEVDFTLTPKGLDQVATKDKTLSFEGDKIKFGTPKISFEMYDYAEGEGGYKYIWYLNEKPLTNKVEFAIETSGLDFFYQPPLTQEYQNGYSEEFQKEIVVSETQVKDSDGNVLAERPENVVCSYAVYHQTKGGMNDINGKEYKTGKAFHIYRPHLFDANGLEAWGILNIDVVNGNYSVEIPQDFLDTAVYPIKSNDTFGFDSQGGSSDGVQDSGIAHYNANRFQSTGAFASIQSISIRIKQYLTQTPDIYAILYADTSSLPAAKIAASSVWTMTTGFDNWKTFSVSGAVTQNLYYWLTLLFAKNGTSYDGSYYYDSSGGTRRYNSNSAWLTPDDPCPSLSNTSTRKVSIYATYTPTGGGSGPSNFPSDFIEFQ